MNQRIKALLGLALILSLFILVSYFVRENQEVLYNLVGDSFLGIIAYITITIIAIVIAPISMMPLIPLAANMWGIFFGGIINIIGWVLGSFIVFYLSRKYGVRLIKKFVSLEKINELEKKVPKENLFFSIVILRMIVPIDILSYALSLFTKINFRTYALTTIIGVTPFAFAFSYLGTVPIYYQIAGFILIGLIVVLIFEFHRKKFKS